MSSSQLFFIHIDDHKYVLTKATLNNYQSSRLYQILSRKIKDPYVVFDFATNMVYIDRDPESFSYIVDMIRGYRHDINNITDQYLKDKIRIDLEYFGLAELINDSSYPSKKTCSQNTDQYKSHQIETLSATESNNITFMTNFMKQFNKNNDESIHNKKSSSGLELILLTEEDVSTALSTSPLASDDIITPTNDAAESAQSISEPILDTSVLKSNDISKINKFMESLNEYLESDPLAAISMMSTDLNLGEFISSSRIRNIVDSDAESLDFNDDE